MNLEITIDISQIEEFSDDLDKVDFYVGVEGRKAMTKALAILEQAIVTRTPVNFGLLRGSIATQITGIPLDMTGEVYTDIPYGWPGRNGAATGQNAASGCLANMGRTQAETDWQRG